MPGRGLPCAETVSSPPSLANIEVANLGPLQKPGTACHHRGCTQLIRRATMARWFGALVGFGCLLGSTAVSAQIYPTRPVTVVVTAAAGGLTDLVARAIGQQLSETWGK